MSYYCQIGDVLTESEMGAKALNLSILEKNTIRVPPGFVVLNKTFEAYLQGCLDQKELKNILKKPLAKLSSKYLMVRSSAVGEDSEDHSFAGQLDSFQSENQIDAVIENLIKCWDSRHNQRLQNYQEQSGMQLKGMGVVVQEMIEPEYAGVLFTKSPLGDQHMLMEYVKGHAEKLVQGEVTPESVEIYDETSFSAKIPFDVSELLQVAKKIEAVYQNNPQDIEWAFKDGKTYFVQARPITNLKEKVFWSNTNVNENYPEKLSPLLYSIARTSYYHYFKNIALKLGIVLKDKNSLEHSFYSIIGLWGDRMYYNMSSIHHLFSHGPLKSLLKNSFDHFVGYQKDSNFLSKTSNLTKTIKFFALLGLRAILLPHYVKRIEKMVNEYADFSKEANTPGAINNSYHQYLDIRFNRWYAASFADLFSMITHGLLGKLCELIDPEKYMGHQNGLIQAIPNLISNQPIHELYDLYILIQENDGSKQLFQNSPEKIWNELENNQKYSNLNQRIQKYLEQWGFRCSGELCFLSQNYIENPTSFIQMLKFYVESKPENPLILFNKKRREQKDLSDELKIKVNQKYGSNKIKAFMVKQSLDLLVRFTCYSISCRERVRLKQSKLYYAFKRLCLNMVTQHKAFNFIQNKHDIFDLEYQEISRILAGDELDTIYLESLIQLRKEKVARSEQKPDNFYSFLGEDKQTVHDQDIIQDDDLPDNAARGLPACGGTIKARVKILESVHEISKLNKGDILVTKQTDPGWISVFPLISGLIVEKGGMLSHGAIVAREFGHPAVVGINNITQILKDDQMVTIQGDTGIITWE